MNLRQAKALMEFSEEVKRLCALCYAHPSMVGGSHNHNFSEMNAAELIYWWSVYRAYDETKNDDSN